MICIIVLNMSHYLIKPMYCCYFINRYFIVMPISNETRVINR